MDKAYWRLERPDYSSDYQDTFINGSGSYPHGLPGINCSVCKKAYGNTYVVPYTCPEKLVKHKSLLKKWPIPQDEHSVLQKQIKAELEASGIDTTSFPSIYDFQPVHLKFPSHPKSDFLWSTRAGPIVSAKVKTLFEQHQVTGVKFCPSVIDKVGKRNSKGPFAIASTGEPEDIIEEVKGEANPAQFGPLHEMVITSTSGRPPGAEVTSQCPACGREEFDNSKRVLVLTKAMIPPTDIFLLATTTSIVVNNRVRELIWKSKLSNAQVAEFPVQDSGPEQGIIFSKQ